MLLRWRDGPDDHFDERAGARGRDIKDTMGNFDNLGEVVGRESKKPRSWFRDVMMPMLTKIRAMTGAA